LLFSHLPGRLGPTLPFRLGRLAAGAGTPGWLR
jgi:hypothetical protein